VNKVKKWIITGAAAVMFFLVSEFGRPFIPPVPLQLGEVTFGTGFIKETFQIQNPLLNLPVGNPQGNTPDNFQIFLLTNINAHLELEEKVRHSWYLNGKRIYSSRFYHINGHKEKGFRLWTYYTLKRVPPGSVLTVRVETEGGQLIGCAHLESFK
jgi:hypothetical protein